MGTGAIEQWVQSQAPYITPQSIPGLMSENKAKVKPWIPPDVAPKNSNKNLNHHVLFKCYYAKHKWNANKGQNKHNNKMIKIDGISVLIISHF